MENRLTRKKTEPIGRKRAHRILHCVYILAIGVIVRHQSPSKRHSFRANVSDSGASLVIKSGNSQQDARRKKKERERSEVRREDRRLAQ